MVGNVYGKEFANIVHESCSQKKSVLVPYVKVQHLKFHDRYWTFAN